MSGPRRQPETGRRDFGTSCTYADDNGTFRELLTDGTGGLDELPHQLPKVPFRPAAGFTGRFGGQLPRWTLTSGRNA
jgi:hypothetical protein